MLNTPELEILFGARIWEVETVTYGQLEVPAVLYHMFKYFDIKDRQHMKIEGIFRQNCNTARLAKL